MYSFTYCANKHPPFNRNDCHLWAHTQKEKKYKEINDYDYYAKQDKINQVFRLKTY